ncbi:MAG: hypothetical protein ABI947_06095 [Chloroflexota bacterium]
MQPTGNPKEKPKGYPRSGLGLSRTSCLTLFLLAAALLLMFFIWGIRTLPRPIQATKIVVLVTATLTERTSIAPITPTSSPTPLPVATKSLAGKIAFLRRKLTADIRPFIINADGTDMHQIDNNNRPMNWASSTPKWSLDGKKITYTDGGSPATVHVINADGTVDFSASDIGDVVYPSWSPDNSHIAVQVGWDGNSSKIVVIDAKGDHNHVELTDGAYPSWSPDGKHILFQAARDGKSTIYVMDPDGSHQVQLTTYGAEGWPSWSPDGQLIAYSSLVGVGLQQLYTMRPDGSHTTKLTVHGQNYMPTWSADSKYIAFYAYRDDQYAQIYVINVDGTNEQKLTNEGDNYQPFWIP